MKYLHYFIYCIYMRIVLFIIFNDHMLLLNYGI